MTEKLKKIIKIRPPFDKRHEDPNIDYGIGAMMFWMVLRGKQGAVSVTFSTQYYPLHTNTKPLEKLSSLGFGEEFDCWDVGFHSEKKPDYMTRNNKQACDYTKSGYCYYDGSSLRGNDLKLGKKFYEQGEKPIWDYLLEYYKIQFEVDDVVIEE